MRASPSGGAPATRIAARRFLLTKSRLSDGSDQSAPSDLSDRPTNVREQAHASLSTSRLRSRVGRSRPGKPFEWRTNVILKLLSRLYQSVAESRETRARRNKGQARFQPLSFLGAYQGSGNNVVANLVAKLGREHASLSTSRLRSRPGELCPPFLRQTGCGAPLLLSAPTQGWRRRARLVRWNLGRRSRRRTRRG